MATFSWKNKRKSWFQVLLKHAICRKTREKNASYRKPKENFCTKKVAKILKIFFSKTSVLNLSSALPYVSRATGITIFHQFDAILTPFWANVNSSSRKCAFINVYLYESKSRFGDTCIILNRLSFLQSMKTLEANEKMDMVFVLNLTGHWYLVCPINKTTF